MRGTPQISSIFIDGFSIIFPIQLLGSTPIPGTPLLRGSSSDSSELRKKRKREMKQKQMEATKIHQQMAYFFNDNVLIIDYHYISSTSDIISLWCISSVVDDDDLPIMSIIRIYNSWGIDAPTSPFSHWLRLISEENPVTKWRISLKNVSVYWVLFKSVNLEANVP